VTVIDLYAGPGGWDEGMRSVGITDVIGVEIEANACATAEAAGHKRVQGDVSAVPIADYAGAEGLVASPPCQAWSMAGKRAGEQDRAKTHALIDAYAAGSNDIGGGWADPRSHHAAQPIRWVRELRPRWVCFEQVPPVLGLWEHAAIVLRRRGYSTWTGVLNSADYGVPQTRERAVLMARLDGPVRPPAPTHAKNPGGEDLFGGQLLPWVSMAEALGWPDSLEVISNYGTGGDPRDKGRRSATEPSATLTSKADRMKVVLRNGVRENAAARDLDEPAPTIFSSRSGNLTWALRNGTNANACVRSADQPAGTLFFGARLNNVSWLLHTNRGQEADGTRQIVDPASAPAPTLTGKSGGQWVFKRPATTVAGDPRISAPGHRDRAGGERQHEQSVRVTVAEAAVLQSFPADYPWQGTKTAQFLQVGNAVPPRLAAAIAGAVTA
jgi:DNA (cytosine-5)-methyltransferase 1